MLISTEKDWKNFTKKLNSVINSNEFSALPTRTLVWGTFIHEDASSLLSSVG